MASSLQFGVYKVQYMYSTIVIILNELAGKLLFVQDVVWSKSQKYVIWIRNIYVRNISYTQRETIMHSGKMRGKIGHFICTTSRKKKQNYQNI